jgi:hypothetical protein
MKQRYANMKLFYVFPVFVYPKVSARNPGITLNFL